MSEGVSRLKARAKKGIVRALSKDGEIHFLLREHMVDDEPNECVCIKDTEVVSVLKKEASKPLLLLRAD
jgi:hypothetical protein